VRLENKNWNNPRSRRRAITRTVPNLPVNNLLGIEIKKLLFLNEYGSPEGQEV
jgi:hypothetical protein